MSNGHIGTRLWTEWRTEMTEHITFSQLRVRTVTSLSSLNVNRFVIRIPVGIIN